MRQLTRREFLELGARVTAMLGLGVTATPKVADAMEALISEPSPVVWLQGQSCSGCTVSMLNSEAPGPAEIMTGYISLLFHSTLSAATGEVGMDVFHKTVERGGYILVVEGSVPSGMPKASVMGGRPISELLTNAAKNAAGIVALGACASFGGIPSAQGNPTGAVGIPEFLKNNRISKPVVVLPGCPAHPDWLVGTLVHLLKFGMPELDEMGRPLAFYSRLVHDQCPRFADYEREKFAKTFAQNGCLFKLGCLGPVTHADCAIRYWNSGINSCIPAGGPCIGCASESFAKSASFPFYRKNEAAIHGENY